LLTNSRRLQLVCRYATGGELFRYLDLEPSGSFPEAWCAFYAGCVLLALDHLHSQDIVYRDLKPENLLLDKEGYIKVVDYGFAKHVTKRTYTVCGTPDYIAPEIILRKGHNKAVDLWWGLYKLNAF
jgi:serine/threonine protein kinase